MNVIILMKADTSVLQECVVSHLKAQVVLWWTIKKWL